MANRPFAVLFVRRSRQLSPAFAAGAVKPSRNGHSI